MVHLHSPLAHFQIPDSQCVQSNYFETQSKSRKGSTKSSPTHPLVWDEEQVLVLNLPSNSVSYPLPSSLSLNTRLLSHRGVAKTSNINVDPRVT